MKKPTSFWIIILLMIFLGMPAVTEARTGGTSSDSSKTSSSSKTKTKNTGSSSYSKTSKTDSAFSNAAKTNQARIAWQERNKPVVAPAPAPVPNVAVPSRDDSKVERQLADIQRQLAEQKRRDQIIAAAQTAAQIAAQAAFNKRQPVTTIPTPQTVTNRPVQLPVNPVNTATTTPEKAEKSGGGSWLITLLVIGGIVFVIYWLLKSKSSQTNYRL